MAKTERDAGTMKPLQLYEELKLLAERVGIAVSEQNFRATGVQAKSGLCKVRGRDMYIMNKHHSVKKKNELLLECLKRTDHENVFVVPAIRAMLESKGEGSE